MSSTGLIPTDLRLRPGQVSEIAAALREANALSKRCEILGGGTKRSLGNPVTADIQLDMSSIRGIEFYEPEELVIKVRAGTPMSEVRAALAEKKQHLPCEPPDLAALFGDAMAGDTIGGIVACNLSGPRRILSGSIRDAVLGMEAVNGLGEIFKGGGRTVKNVTGYDLPKLLVGSFGVLAVITAVTLKVHPAPAREATLLFPNLGDVDAIRVMGEALRMPLDISAASHLTTRESYAVTALRLEGFPESVAARRAELQRRLQRLTDVTVIEGEDSAVFWRRRRDLSDFAGDPLACLWRLLLPVSHAARVAAAVGGEALYDWGGSRIFLKTNEETVRTQGNLLRSMVEQVGGTACLFKAPAGLRQAFGAFHPRPKAHQDLAERIRARFDPNNVLNPGKFVLASQRAT
jgi:glycolate oxidase FAD binding subunit